MPTKHTETLENLLVGSTRLTRLAAQRTGNTMVSAVWTTLSVLSTEGPRRIGDLAKLARISQPGMTKVVQNLVADEWVLRIADVDDSRAWLIDITPTGRTALLGWRGELASALEGVFTDLSDTEWKTLEKAAAILLTKATNRPLETKEEIA